MDEPPTRKPPIGVTTLPTPEEFRAWRKRLGLTQEDAAELFGYTRTWVGMIERGENEMSRVMALAMIGLEAQHNRDAITTTPPPAPEPPPSSIIVELATALAGIAVEAGEIDVTTNRATSNDIVDVLLRAIALLPDDALVRDGDLTPLACDFAAMEGWGVFWDDETERQTIQHLDNTEWFKTDAEALEHVKQAAKAGSRLHQIALAITKGVDE
jgi:transcriptional regulator with XRE-family HTH domain